MYEKISIIIKSKVFQNFIVGLIILNGITLGLETSKDIVSDYGYFLHTFDKFVIFVFTIEIILRIYIYKIEFFKDGWSIFDFIIVVISLLPSGQGFEIFRILRVLRLFRLITIIPQMRKIILALIGTIPGMATIAGLLGLFFYIFAIMATNLYSETFPEWFGDLGDSFYTLFQVMTLESWSMGIVRPIMEKHPYAWAFFIPFIFMVTFIMINLIVAVVVDAMNEMGNKDNIENKTDQSLKNEIKELKQEIKELKEIIKSAKNN